MERPMTWREVVAVLEARLAQLAEAGFVHLTVPENAELAAARRKVESGRPASPHMAGGEVPARAAESVPTPAAPARAPFMRPARKSSHPIQQEPLAESLDRHPSEFDTLDSLAHHFRDCRRCGLAAHRGRLVFGVGHARPKLLFIGEGPGQEEDVQGLPFVGRAGQLLTAGIEALGLTRDDVYIANVVKCRPPGNRTPAPEEIAACAPILQRQIELLDPALIVVLGNVSLKALNPDARGITVERGRLFDYRNWRVLPTYHPAFLLRNPGAMESWWADLRQAFRIAYGAEA
jgi:DNA polymerase